MSYSDYSNTQLSEKLDALTGQLENVQKEIAFIKETMIKADTTIANVAEQVMPTITELTNSPMLKMFMGKKK